MGTSLEGVKRKALSRLGWGEARVAVLTPGSFVLWWVVSSSSIYPITEENKFQAEKITFLIQEL